ncbi:hypothetical protein ACFLZW_01225 [Chloroflexota bacterium]
MPKFPSTHISLNILIGFWSLCLNGYAATIRQAHTFDALAYVHMAHYGLLDRYMPMVHPHHILYHPLSFIFYRFWQILGWQGNAILPLQILNALLSTIVILLFYRLLQKLTNIGLAFGIAILLSVTNAYWYFSTEVEVYILSLLFLVALFYWITVSPTSPRTSSHDIITGLLLGLAILAHQTNTLFFPIILAGIWMSPTRWNQKAKSLFQIGLTASILVIAAYGVGISALEIKTVLGILTWSTGYAHMDAWGQWWGFQNNFNQALFGIQRSIVAILKDPSIFVDWLTIIGLLLVAWGAYRNNRKIASYCILWVVIYGAFFLWWEPANFEFWLAVLPPILLMSALAISRLNFQYKKQVVGIALLGICLALLYVNYRNALVPTQGPTKGTFQQIARGIATCASHKTDIVIIASYAYKPWVDIYAPAITVPLDGVFWLASLDHSGNQVSKQAFADLEAIIQEAKTKNTRIFVSEDIFQGSFFASRANVTPTDLEVFFAQYLLYPTQCSYQVNDASNAQKTQLYLLNY